MIALYMVGFFGIWGGQDVHRYENRITMLEMEEACIDRQRDNLRMECTYRLQIAHDETSIQYSDLMISTMCWH